MSLEGLKLLLVDDEADLCQVLSWDFEDVGIQVTTAYGGNEAIDLLKGNQFDVVLSDIKMPNGDGVELLEYIHKNRVEIKGVFLMTGYSDYPVKDLMEMGLNKLFKKPIEVDELLNEFRALG